MPFPANVRVTSERPLQSAHILASFFLPFSLPSDVGLTWFDKVSHFSLLLTRLVRGTAAGSLLAKKIILKMNYCYFIHDLPVALFGFDLPATSNYENSFAALNSAGRRVKTALFSGPVTTNHFQHRLCGLSG